MFMVGDKTQPQKVIVCVMGGAGGTSPISYSYAFGKKSKNAINRPILHKYRRT